MADRPADAAQLCVLLPGMLCTPEVFAPQRAALEAVLPVVDLPLTADRLDRAVADVLAVDAGRLLLVGLSLGGIVAMAAAVRAPQRVAGLAVLSANAAAPRPDQRALWSALAARTRVGEFTAAVDDVVTGIRPGAHAPLARAMAHRVGPDRFLAQLALQSTRGDLHTGLRAVTAPALVVHGRGDPLCPPEFGRRIAAALPSGSLRVLAGGHLITLEDSGVTPALTGLAARSVGARVPGPVSRPPGHGRAAG